MRTLIHFPHDPLSRQVRLVLNEKSLHAQEIEKHPLDRLDDIATINPAVTLPVLQDEPPHGGTVTICPVNAILEYLEEVYPKPALIPGTAAGRAEVRRLLAWFNDKFYREVHPFLAGEFIDKRLSRKGQPDPEQLRHGRDQLVWHMDYINWLCEHRSWIGDDRLSLADFVCAAHLSVHDYCDLVPWSDFPHAKDWYARIKSRPAMRVLLQERIQGLPASRHYDNPDF